VTTVLRASPRRFVSTPSIDRIAVRALRYLESGFSVHLRGPAGTGKTTLAIHLADLLTRPIMLIYGDDESKSSDLIGSQLGYTRKKVVDNFIHSVVKVEDELKHNWVDSRLTMACREGFTLVYDEFNRSRPEVNNVLLSALEEKLLVLPPSSNQTEYVRVSPDFRAILTSNPEEYCGVHGTQDALMDRLVTINMPEPDELTQQEILVQKTNLDRASALLIVRLIKTFRARSGGVKASGLRSAVVIAQVCQKYGISVSPDNLDFREICSDVLLSRSELPLDEATKLLWHLISDLEMSNSTNKPTSGLTVSSSLQPTEVNTSHTTTTIYTEPYTAIQVENLVQVSDNAEESLELTLNEQLAELLKEIPTASEEFSTPPEEEIEETLTGETLIEETLIEAMLEESDEDRLYRYLAHTNGAGLSDVESEFGMARTQILDIMRSLTRNGQVVHRDRRFFAVIPSKVEAREVEV
jgi:gas vesicle protein GvpN